MLAVLGCDLRFGGLDIDRVVCVAGAPDIAGPLETDEFGSDLRAVTGLGADCAKLNAGLASALTARVRQTSVFMILLLLQEG